MISSTGNNPREAAFEASKSARLNDVSTVRKTGFGQKSWHPIRVALVAVGAVLLFSAGLFGFQLKDFSGKVFANTKKASFFSSLSQVVNSKSVVLKGSERDRINILLLGIGGGTHDGPNLTDTMILASIKPSTEQVAMVSVPRDLYVQIPGYWSSKINAAHAFAEDSDGTGIEVAKETIGQIVLGQPVDYYVRLDFDGFRQAIDDLGGIDVTVPQGFYDYHKKVTFTAGVERMTGERALAFSRARYVEGPEGSDFARASRQQLIIKALRDQILGTNSIGDLVNLGKAIDALGSHIKTDLGAGELMALYKLTKDLDTSDIINLVIDGEKTGLVYGDSVPMGGVNASVLIPTAGMFNFSEIHRRTSTIFDINLLENEDASVEVQNGSTVVGIGLKAAEEIPMSVLATINAAKKDYTKTVIIDYSSGAYPHAKAYLEGKFDTTAVSSGELDVPRQSQADFVVIVGSEYAASLGE